VQDDEEPLRRVTLTPAEPGPAEPPAGRRMRVVRRDDVVSRFDAAVRQILEREALALPPAARRAVRMEIGKALDRMLTQRGRQIRGLTRTQFLARLSESHDRLLDERVNIRQEIDGLRDQLGQLRSEAGAAPVDLEAQLARRLDESGLGRCLSTGLARDIVEFAAGAVREMAPAAGSDPRETDLLKRRVAKMTAEIAHLEDALKEMMRAQRVDPGVASIYECVQGLSELDLLYEKKSEMLRDVFEANQVLRARLAGERGD